MNPNQYPPQPGQTPQGYPPQQPGGGPYSGYPPQQQGGYPPQAAYGPPQPGQQPYGPQQPGYPGQQQMQPMPTNGYNPYPYPGESTKPGSSGPNKMVLGVVAVIIIVGILFAVLSAGSGSKTPTSTQPQTQTTDQTKKVVADVVPRTDGQLDLTSRIGLSKNLKAQSIQANVQEQVNLSSGFSFMATKYEDYVSTNPATVPADGKKFIVVTAVVGNRNDTSNISVSYLDFRLRDQSNVLIAGSVTTNELLANPLSSPTELKPGEQLTGKVVFEVNVNDTTWVFKHSETYQKTTDNTSFIVEGEIVLGVAPISSTGTPTANSGSGTSARTAAPSTTTTPPPAAGQ